MSQAYPGVQYDGVEDFAYAFLDNEIDISELSHDSPFRFPRELRLASEVLDAPITQDGRKYSVSDGEWEIGFLEGERYVKVNGERYHMTADLP